MVDLLFKELAFMKFNVGGANDLPVMRQEPIDAITVVSK